MCEDNIEIGVTEITNNILVSATPNDQIIDINVTETTEDVTLNITPSVVEVNIDVTQELITEIVTIDAETCVNIIDVSITDATDNVTLNITPSIVEVNINRGESTFKILEVESYSALPTVGEKDTYYVTLDTNKLYRWDLTDEAYVEVSSGTAVWGQITGSLSNQTDLWNALNSKQNQLNGTGFVKASGTTISYDNSTYLTTSSAASTYVPYTGANANVNLGEWGLSSGYVSLDNTPTGTPTTAGTLSWNDTDGTADLKLKGGNVTLQIGQESVVRVVNKTGATLNEADFRAVRIRSVSEGGAQGQRLAVLLAQGDNDADSATTIGLVTENILDNQEGFITIVGEVKEIDTTGAKSYGGLETWVDGDMLYLSPTHAGYLTNVKPVAPQHMVIIGYVVYAHANHGKIFVKVDNGYELDELHNVKITNVQYQDLLTWSTITGTWINNSFEGILGYQPIGLGFISSSATGLTYNAETGIFTWTSGYSLPTNTKQGQWDTAYTNRITSATSPLSIASNTISISQASGTTDGYLSSTDWTTFNNKQAALGYTPVPTTRTLTINGVSYDLSADRTWTISTGSGITGSGANGQVTFWTGTSAISGSNNFFWNNSTARLGIGTNSPSAQLHTTLDVIIANDIKAGHGSGASASNIVFGGGLPNRTSGVANTIFGYNSGDLITSGSANTYIGSQAGKDNTTGANNISIGALSGGGNGHAGGIFIGNGTSEVANSSNSIVIGFNTTGNGSNTSTIGTDNTTDTYLRGALHQDFVTSSLLKTDSTGKIVAAVAGTDYLGGISATSPLTLSSGVLSISQANTSTSGYLSSTDWNTFNGKQTALSGTGFVKVSGSTISYDNTTYTPSSRTLTINGTAYDLSADRSWTITAGSGMRNVQSFTATANQTTFTITGGYTTGLIDVYVNGARLSASDYTATDGTSVVLGVGVVVNDIVDIVAYTASLTSGVSGSGTSGYLAKWSGSTSINGSLIYDNGTNVGIGTASPSYKLDVSGTARFTSSILTTDLLVDRGGGTWNIIPSSGSNDLYFKEMTGGNIRMTILGNGNVGIGTFSPTAMGSYKILEVQNATGGIIRYTNTSAQGGYIAGNNGGLTYDTLGAFPHIFYTNGSSRMMIASNGRVGIGTSSPSTKLHIVGSGASGGSLKVQTTGGVDAYLSLTDNTREFLLGSSGGNFYLYDATSAANRIVLNSSGYVGIGVTNPTEIFNVYTAQIKWLVNLQHGNGTQFFLNFMNPSGGQVGSVMGNGTTTSYNVTSDYRLKEDLKPIKGLEQVSKINVYDFKWKNSNDRMDGVLAHELQKILPFAVTGIKDGKDNQQVDYSKIVPVLVQAIKELNAKLEAK